MSFKFIILAFLIVNNAIAQSDQFEKEAKALASDLKTSLMKNLSEKIAKEGPVAAIPFCHANVKPIAKDAAKERMTKYEFGRTSHKLRNAANAPEPWAKKYFKDFEGKQKGEMKLEYFVFTLPNSKRVYMEPLYVEAKCLLCHGNNVSKQIKEKIHELYPKDQATGFKLGEFRGFIWVKEK
jgi:hypothetical protein